MKKLASILVLVLAVTFSTQAQKKRDHKRPEFTIEQQADLSVKKMTLALDLSNKQQNQIKPLIIAKMTERKAFVTKRKEAKKEDKKPTSDQMYAIKSKMLDNQIAMKNSMKEILNKEQFDKFEKMHKKRMMKGKKMMKKGRKGNKKKENK